MGERCPYHAHEPLTDAGWQAWDVILRCSGQLRLAPQAGIVIGIDMSAAVGGVADRWVPPACGREDFPDGDYFLIL